MDDDKIITEENQRQEELVVEEAPQDMNFDLPPPVYQENNNQYMFIVGGAILFLILLFVIIRAIFFGKPNSSKPVSLIYWGLWEDKEVIEPLIAAYQQKNPNIKITYQKMQPQSYREKLVSRSKSEGTGQGAIEKPDIFRFHNTWLPEIKDIVSPLPVTVMGAQEFDKTFILFIKKILKLEIIIMVYRLRLIV